MTAEVLILSYDTDACLSDRWCDAHLVAFVPVL